MVIDVSKLTGQEAETQKLRYEALKGRNAVLLSGSMFVQFMSNGMKDQFRYTRLKMRRLSAKEASCRDRIKHVVYPFVKQGLLQYCHFLPSRFSHMSNVNAVNPMP